MSEKSDAIKRLCESFSDCTRCPLSRTRTKIVFGRGEPDAKLMFIGEAPGRNEDESGLPFVGQAGMLLQKFLTFAGISETDYYITNILKCRPPQNRDPEPSEEEACMQFLRSQVSIIDPKIIVCLGRISAKRIIDPDFRITRDRGKWFEMRDKKIMATYHPSALLRDPAKKYDFLTDIKTIKNILDSLN